MGASSFPLALLLAAAVMVQQCDSFILSPLRSLPQNQVGCRFQRRPTFRVYNSQNEDEDISEEDSEDEPTPIIGKEKSTINSYIPAFLKKNKVAEEGEDSVDDKDIPFDPTHLIAIPMEDCHALHLELESVQRAITYRCGILTSACLVPAQLKMPLLYVGRGNGGADMTQELASVVRAVVKKHMSVAQDKRIREEALENGDGYGTHIGSFDEEDEDEDANSKPRPLTMDFSTLELDGMNNGQLFTVAIPDRPGTKRLQAMVADLKRLVESMGYVSRYPNDPNKPADSETQVEFRPRFPFMTLPKEFDDKLTKIKTGEVVLARKDQHFLDCENGGNGISPIFFCNWWDDQFGKNIRLPEIGVYPRENKMLDDLLSGKEFGSKSEEETEKAPLDSIHLLEDFRLQYEVAPLPKANAKSMRRAEEEAREYNLKRWEEEEKSMEEREEKETKDALLEKTRSRLESVYKESVDSWTADMMDIDEKSSNKTTSTADEPAAEKAFDVEENEEDKEDEEDFQFEKYRPKASDDDFVDEWTKQRIKQAIEARTLRKERQLAEDEERRKNKPPIEENPVFINYKKNAEEELERMKNKKSRATKPALGKYPTREHFMGIWQVVSSPTGFGPDESGTNENLILRVDGTTAGGPILDKETKQKAGGGSWKMVVGDDNQVQLHIRLVIPPKKERILVLDGDVMRLGGDSLPMASKMFGIPELEERFRRAQEKDSQEYIHCQGVVHIEDAITKANRKEIGTFTLLKIHDLKPPGEYTITVPRPVRNQD